ncbi:MAG: phytanoyl-CoA dioxygenase family protein [Proteobacteria bacterium]|nr:phytanoyl-CoA dioxygenase family protein [Pseudomonadota bacterium]
MVTIGKELIQQYREDGVIRVENAFGDDWIAKMRVAVDQALDRPGEYTMDIDQGKPGRYVFDTWLWPVFPSFKEIVFESPAAEIGAAIMEADRVNLVFDFISVKEPNSDKPTAWHQDAPGNPVEGPQAMSMWISLDEVTPESGALRFARGSHKWGRRFEPTGSGDVTKHQNYRGRGDGEQRPAGLEDMPNIDANLNAYDIVTIGAKPGDAIVFDMLMCHAAGSNKTERRRRAIGLRFAGEQATYAVRNTRLSIHPNLDVGLADGAHFPPDPAHHIFPQIWSR